jgi:hypothetical protein
MKYDPGTIEPQGGNIGKAAASIQDQFHCTLYCRVGFLSEKEKVEIQYIQLKINL